MILLVEICYFWEAYLIPTVLILVLLQVVPAAPQHIGCTTMPTVCHSISSHAHQVWRLVGTVSTQVRSRLDVVAPSVASSNILKHTLSHVLSILGVVLWLLTIYQCHSIDIIILMIGVLISSHDELFLSSFEADWTYWLGTLARDVDVCHVLVWATSGLWWDVVLSLLVC